jgi:hypothetical protein
LIKAVPIPIDLAQETNRLNWEVEKEISDGLGDRQTVLNRYVSTRGQPGQSTDYTFHLHYDDSIVTTSKELGKGGRGSTMYNEYERRKLVQRTRWAL